MPIIFTITNIIKSMTLTWFVVIEKCNVEKKLRPIISNYINSSGNLEVAHYRGDFYTLNVVFCF